MIDNSSDRCFYKKRPFNPQKNLHWTGLRTLTDLYSMYGFVEMFAKKERRYQNLKMFDKVLEYFEPLSQEQLNSFQRQYLELSNHDQFSCIYNGFLDTDRFDLLRNQSNLYYRAAMFFAKEVACNKGLAPSFEDFLEKKYTSELTYYRKIMSTCMYNYSYFSPDDRYQTLAENAPFYADCGIDFLYTDDEIRLAELQFSYQSYPQNLTILYSAISQIFPELFEGYSISEYLRERLLMLEQYIEAVSHYKNVEVSEIKHIVLDAWGAIKHPARSYEQLAKQLKANFYVFDEFVASGGKKYRDILDGYEVAFFYNQPFLCFMDPRKFFESYTQETIEQYPHLRLDGMFEDYLNQKVFLANSPITDLLNDKGIYGLLPYMVEHYLDEKPQIGVSVPHPLWDDNDPLLVNKDLMKYLEDNKEACVICHRYLESDDGVRVGRFMDDYQWKHFIDTYIREKPYLFVMRDYFEMDPDVSLRVFNTGYAAENMSIHNTVSSDTILGRINPTGRPVIEKSYYFLCLKEKS